MAISTNYEAHPVNAKGRKNMTLAEVLDEAANFVENYIGDHMEDYDGKRDSMYISDMKLAKELRRHLDKLA